MEKPVSLSADDIRDEKVKVLRSLQVVEKSDVVIGQHTAANGIPGYLEDEGVPDDSSTPTFAAMCLHIDNDRSVLLSCNLQPICKTSLCTLSVSVFHFMSTRILILLVGAYPKSPSYYFLHRQDQQLACVFCLNPAWMICSI